MATSKDFVQKFIADLTPYGVRVRPMMGDYVVYCNETVVGDICDNRFYVKITPTSNKMFTDADIGVPYPGAKPHFVLEKWEKDRLGMALQLLAAGLQ